MRPSWDEYYMEMAEVAKKRSTCNRRQVGAVIVKDQRILASGYNGAPSGLPHCSETGCIRQKLNVPSGERHELCRGLHAEQNAIIQAALHGVPIEGSAIYVTHKPCVICTKMMINAGIKKLIYQGDYPDSLSEEMLKEAGILVEKYTKDKES
ncbi:deoxycytidylate deaminase [Clostridium aceticum]|uniref:Deoxycytidylate deaminase n=1 Tax=Clostridium aceticum TaxID=84022 RepID=A0A0D8I960_9CLOT|nr:cytidine/deoxycytidylate deaminase family protein [Clostridium aceticum]AKL93725.1 deoxycytidylate deaminase [Clostridium aceticum]KJF25771.1 cytidine deaminase [Clostridium aceticum]